jgi:hypothetical protein
MELLAPNGQPSKLTPEQYRLVRTSAFKKWFGDWENFDYQKNKELKCSEIIDFRDYSDLEKEFTNEPLVLYHASNNEFNVFDIEKSDYREKGWFGKGFYFGESEEKVRQYGKIIKPYFLKLSNPFYFDGHQKDFAEKFDLDYWENYNLYSNTIREKIIKLGYDGVVANSVWGVEYVAFYPNQIKLADGTNTTFDTNNPDIRYADGGSINDFTYDIGGL